MRELNRLNPRWIQSVFTSPVICWEFYVGSWRVGSVYSLAYQSSRKWGVHLDLPTEICVTDYQFVSLECAKTIVEIWVLEWFQQYQRAIESC